MREAADLVLGRVARGEEDDRHARALGAEPLGDVEALHVGQHHVEHDQVGLERADRGERVARRCRRTRPSKPWKRRAIETTSTMFGSSSTTRTRWGVVAVMASSIGTEAWSFLRHLVRVEEGGGLERDALPLPEREVRAAVERGRRVACRSRRAARPGPRRRRLGRRRSRRAVRAPRALWSLEKIQDGTLVGPGNSDATRAGPRCRPERLAGSAPQGCHDGHDHGRQPSQDSGSASPQVDWTRGTGKAPPVRPQRSHGWESSAVTRHAPPLAAVK